MNILSIAHGNFQKEIRSMFMGMKIQEKVKKIKVIINSGTTAGGFLVVAGVLGNFLNFIYNAYLGRRISVEEFGLVSLIGSFLFLVTIPTSALARTVTHKSAYFLGKYGYGVKQFWVHTRLRALALGLIATIIWLTLTPLLADCFRASSSMPFILFAPVWFISTVGAVDEGFLSGILKFKIIASLIVIEAVVKLVCSLIFIETGYTQYVYAAIPLSMFIVFLLAWFFARSQKEAKLDIDVKRAVKFPTKFFVTSSFTKISTVAFLSFDLILAKHFLPPTEAGQYALISLVGKMIFFVGGLFSGFINPLVSREEGARRNSHIIFYQLLLATTICSLFAYLVVGVLGYLTVPILLGSKVEPILYLLPIYGLAMFFFTVSTSIISFYQTRNKHAFAILGLLMAVIQVIGIYFYHGSLVEIIRVMTVVGAASFVLTILAHFLYQPIKTVTTNIRDFLDVFTAIPWQVPEANDKQKILIFNWRDTRHVWAGGAEVYIHEIAKRIAKRGNYVALFCGNDGKSPRNEIIDGVNIIRRGGCYTVYIWAVLYYIFKFRNKFDVIVDSENGIPFFSPLYAKEPVIGLVHHVHQDIFRKHLIFPFSQFAQFLEGQLMPFVYRNKKMITVSNSSKVAMEVIGFGKTDAISVVNPGVDHSLFKPLKKSEKPTILYLGRLKPYKSIDILIRAMSQVTNDISDATLTIAGDGESRMDLEKLVHKLNLQNAVSFAGKVSERVKAELLAKSWLIVQPSKIEGWGITVIEANASGTPVIASDVSGLRDSVNNPHSGYLVPWGQVNKFAKKIELILTDKKGRKKLEKGSQEWAKNFSWEKSAKIFYNTIRNDSRWILTPTKGFYTRNNYKGKII